MSIIVSIKSCELLENKSQLWIENEIDEFLKPLKHERARLDYSFNLDSDTKRSDVPTPGRGAELSLRKDNHPGPLLCCHRVELPVTDARLVRLETEIAIRLYGCRAILVQDTPSSAQDRAGLGDDLAFLLALAREYGVPLLRAGVVPCGQSRPFSGQDCPNSALPPWAADH